MPALERIESVVDVDATLSLLGQAYEIIFRELQNFVEFTQKFEGINWKIFVRLVNRFRKIGTYFKLDDGTGILAGLAGVTSAAVVDDDGNYGNEDYGNEYGNDYEGGEKENGFIDIEVEEAQ